MIRSHRKTVYEALGRDPVHPFPARMAPGIALDLLSRAGRAMRVLDPMMGSGTVLAVARSQGHHAIGLDVDPLGVLMSKVWTTATDIDEARDKGAEVLWRARRLFLEMRTRDAYPSQDRETRRFAAYWFDSYVRRQLASLSLAISRVRDHVLRDVLWCAFSRLIITKQAGVSLAMDLAHSRPHRSYERAPVKPFNGFLSALDRVLENCVDKRARRRGPAPVVRRGDARYLPLPDASVDLVRTSPPYLNAIDYFRCSKYSLIWMGHSIENLRRLRHESIGTESRGDSGDGIGQQVLSDLQLRPRLAHRQEGILLHYIDDMRRVFCEVSRVLVPGGKAVCVIGENTVRGTFVRNSKIISAVAQLAGLDLCDRRLRTLPADRRYLPPPAKNSSSAALDGRMRREAVLAFMKPTA